MNIFVKNLDIVFFIYGLAFAVMGIVIFIQRRRRSIFRLSDIIWLLAAFGLIHSLNEWLEMFAIIRGGHSGWFNLVQLTILTVSFVFLFEFGRRLICLRDQRFLNKWVTFFLCFLVLVLICLSKYERSIWPRYFLGLPGGLFAAWGFISYYKTNKSILKPIVSSRYFVMASVAMGIYAILTGIVTPQANFFPASVINNVSFLNLFGIPVQVFRALCAMIISWATVGILNIFNLEHTAQLNNALSLKEKITEGIDEGIMLIDKDFKVLWANKRQKELYEYIEGDHCYHMTHQRTTPCQPPNDICPIEEVLKTRKSSNIIHTHFDGKGNKVFVEVSAYPVKDESGRIVEFIHVSKDITERKKTEEELKIAYIKLKETQDQLIQSEKLNAIGQLASGVAHEVRNPLGIILQGVNYLETEISADETTTFGVLNTIKENIKRTDKIIAALLDFSKAVNLEQKPEDINSVLEDSLVLVKEQIELNGIEVTRELKSGLPRVMIEKNKIEQVFINLFLNSIQAMPNRGRIIIRSYGKKLAEIAGGMFLGLEDNFEFGEKAVIVEIEDTGCGIPEANLKKIFDPFFTTKDPNIGTGLGLSVSWNILKMHKALVEAKSREGQGTKMIITFRDTGEKKNG